MALPIQEWPADARQPETTFCKVPFAADDLSRFADIAKQDMERVYANRPELKGLRVVTVLAEQSADHWVNKKGFRCISLWTFFAKKEGVKTFHPKRHTRIDFGSDKFGHSSWSKHPVDKGFKGRGVNNFGRSIEVKEGKSIQETLSRYLTTSKTNTANTLKKYPMVVLWPPEEHGKVLFSPEKESGKFLSKKRKRESTEVSDSPSKKAAKTKV